MSNLKLSSDLFLGTHEMNFLKESMKDNGFVRILNNAVVSYGVVNSPNDVDFKNLQVYQSSINKIGIRSGFAIDGNLNIIHINSDLIDQFTIQPDTLRYVVISHKFTTIEKGTVSIQADGSIVGVGTEFTKRLRGLPDFASKIVFESNVNTQEYLINAVQSDTLAGLNVALTDIVPENDVEYRVVGTFTPSATISDSNKYPFESDDFTLELRDSPTLADNEYLLAEILFNGVRMDIFDKRISNQFSLIDTSSEDITDENKVVGVEQIMYDSTKSTMHENLVKIGWGIESLDWTINAATQELLLNTGAGGSWGSLTPFVDGDFDDWYAVFENTGQVIQIQKSIKAGGNISLNLDFSKSYPSDGGVSIVPNSDHIEVTVLNVGNPTADKKLTFASISRYAIIPIQAGSESIIQYRHLSRDQVSLGRTINNGSYIQEPSFDESGQQVSQGVKNYFDGRITPLLSVANLYDRLTCGFIRMWSGTPESIPSGYYLCDGENGTIDLRGQFIVGYDPNNEKFDKVGNSGGTEDEYLEVKHLPAHGHTGTATGGEPVSLYTSPSPRDATLSRMPSSA